MVTRALSCPIEGNWGTFMLSKTLHVTTGMLFMDFITFLESESISNCIVAYLLFEILFDCHYDYSEVKYSWDKHTIRDQIFGYKIEGDLIYNENGKSTAWLSIHESDQLSPM